MARKGFDVTLFRDMSPEGERPVKRASFDIYEDQLNRLGQLKYTRGEKISDMVRHALEEYLAKHQA